MDSNLQPYKTNYQVKVTKQAIRQGHKLGLTNKSRLWIISQMKLIKHWPEIGEQFDYEMADKALEFKFYVESKWIRVFVYKDDDRKIMWVIKAITKKTNELSTTDMISLRTAISVVETDLNNYRREQKHQKKLPSLKSVKGGKQND